MKIIFGWSNFKIKSFTPKELNLSSDDTTEFEIEVRQSYFHLFWIPFFSLGKKWGIRKDNRLYEVPAHYEHLIHTQKLHVRTPWYTFSGPIVIVVALLAWALNTLVSDQRIENATRTLFEKEVRTLDSTLKHLTPNHFLKVKDLSNIYHETHVYLKVEALKGDSLKVTYVNTGTESYKETPMHVEQYYLANKDLLTQFTIPLSLLEASINRDYKLNHSPFTPGIKLFNGDSIEYSLEEAETYFGPIVKDNRTGSYGTGHLNMNLVNLGWPGKIIALTTQSGGIQWQNQLPIDFPTGKYSGINLRATNYTLHSPYRFTMELIDSSGRKHKYMIEGHNLDKTISKIPIE